jgi:hypothetical protein
MSDTSVTIEIEEPYAGMIRELKDELNDEKVDADLRQLIYRDGGIPEHIPSLN